MQRVAVGDGPAIDPEAGADAIAAVMGERLPAPIGGGGAARDQLSGGLDGGADDVTEVDELRLQLERMVALDKMKSDYMHLTVHELRSPLAIVYGYLSMIESGMLGELSPALRGAVEPSMRSVELMTQLVTELIETARLDEAHLETAEERVDVAPSCSPRRHFGWAALPVTISGSTSGRAPPLWWEIGHGCSASSATLLTTRSNTLRLAARSGSASPGTAATSLSTSPTRDWASRPWRWIASSPDLGGW